MFSTLSSMGLAILAAAQSQPARARRRSALELARIWPRLVPPLTDVPCALHFAGPPVSPAGFAAQRAREASPSWRAPSGVCLAASASGSCENAGPSHPACRPLQVRAAGSLSAQPRSRAAGSPAPWALTRTRLPRVAWRRRSVPRRPPPAGAVAAPLLGTGRSATPRQRAPGNACLLHAAPAAHAQVAGLALSRADQRASPRRPCARVSRPSALRVVASAQPRRVLNVTRAAHVRRA